MSDLLAGTTPGPWEVEGELDPSGIGSRPWVGRLEEWRYSALSCGDTAAEALANAKLIAAAPTLATENTDLRSLCAELVEACASMIRWDDAEKNARPFDEDNGAGFYARMEMCGEAFEKARAAIARSKELLP